MRTAGTGTIGLTMGRTRAMVTGKDPSERGKARTEAGPHVCTALVLTHWRTRTYPHITQIYWKQYYTKILYVCHNPKSRLYEHCYTQMDVVEERVATGLGIVDEEATTVFHPYLCMRARDHLALGTERICRGGPQPEWSVNLPMRSRDVTQNGVETEGATGVEVGMRWMQWAGPLSRELVGAALEAGPVTVRATMTAEMSSHRRRRCLLNVGCEAFGRRLGWGSVES